MIKDYLKNIPLFKSLTQSELEYLSEVSKERIYKKSNVIVSEGSKRNFIYIVKKGKVKLYKTSREETSIILDIKGEDSVLGGAILFSDIPNPATIMTIEDSIIYVIKTSDIENLVLNNSNLALDIIKILGNELLVSQEKIKNLALDDTYTKVLKLLLDLSERYGVPIDNNSLELDLLLTRSEMASLVGASRETVSRTLNQLSKEKFINIDRKKIVIIDKCKLKEWSK